MKLTGSLLAMSIVTGGTVLILLLRRNRKAKSCAAVEQARKQLSDSASYVPCFELNSFLSNPIRFSKQLLQRFNTRIFCPPCGPDVKRSLTRKSERAKQMASEVVVQCRCGKCKVIAHNGGGHTTVCHCSICRYHNGGIANPWKAVDRHSCFLAGVPESDNIAWTTSSFFSRRGRCAHCNSVLMMDYEYFEPNTVWLGNPSIAIRDDSTGAVVESVPIQQYELGGLVDADVCWGSRDVPMPKDGLLTDFGGFFDKSSGGELTSESSSVLPVTDGSRVNTLPRGKEQWEDIDWSRYYIDSGKL
mmetsp:Transcript_20343/g.37746  ORF Transcript_20343/g.37746 Transcript_20343/m.37746 type:complete len:302 (+) Transcript_20343:28-933(+)